MRRDAPALVSGPAPPPPTQSGHGARWFTVRGPRLGVGVVVGHVLLGGAGGGGGVPVLLGRGGLCWSVPGDQDVLRLEPPVALLHGPDRDDDPPAHPEDPRQLPDGPHSPLRGGDVMDDSDRHHGVKTVIFVWKSQVITDEHLVLLLSCNLCQVLTPVSSDIVDKRVAAEIFPTPAT